MRKVYEFLKKCETYYLATTDGSRPRVRPFGTISLYENKLYFQTGRSKNVYRQLKANPQVELCAVLGERWIRVDAAAVEDSRLQASEDMLEKYPTLKGMYKADDGNGTVFYLKDATATIYSMDGKPEVIRF